MPNYCYTNSKGETIERFYYVNDVRPNNIWVGGMVYRRDMAAELGQRRPGRCGTWPMKSDALGVAEDQIQEAAEEARRHGVPTEFTKDGRAILTSPKHRKAYAELYGMYDRNGGYGDPQRR